MKFEDFKKMPEEGKEVPGGLLKRVAAIGAGIVMGLAANAAEQPTTLDNGDMENNKEMRIDAESQDLDLDEGAIDFFAAEQEMKQKQLEQYMHAYEQAEKNAKEAQAHLQAFENDFLVALTRARAYIESQTAREYKQAAKTLDGFEAQSFLDGIKTNLTQFIHNYQAQGVSFADMQSLDIMMGMITKAVKTGDPNAALLYEAITDKNIGDAAFQQDKDKRDVLQNPARPMAPLMIAVVQAQQNLDQAQADLDAFHAENPIFASK